MNILFLKGFNNYFNRTVKKYSTLSDYQSNSTSYLDYSSINFNPNDGIATELIIGSTSQQEPGTGSSTVPLKWEFNGTPDYAVCYEMEGTPAAAVIKFRWFVMDAERTRNGQYRIALKRDVLADHLNEILDAPCFVEKGIVSNKDSSLLYNNEAMTYNQIKTQELPLKDSTNSGWIVGYLAKNRANTPHSVSTTMSVVDGTPVEYYDEDDLPFTVSTTSSTSVYNYIRETLTTAIASTHIQSGGWANYYIQQGWKLNNKNTNAIKVAETNNTAPSFVSTGYIIPKTGQYAPQSSQDVYNYLMQQGYSEFVVDADIPIYDNNGNVVFTATPIEHTTPINLADKYCYYTGWGSEGPEYPSAIQRNASIYNAITPTISSTLLNRVNTLMNSLVSVTSVDIKTTYNDKFVKVGSNYYRMSISEKGTDRYDVFTSTSNPTITPTFTGKNGNSIYSHTDSTIGNEIATLISSQNGDYVAAIDTTAKNSSFVIAKSTGYNIVLTQVAVEQLDVTLQTGKRQTYDCVADIFAIPYGDMKFKLTDAGSTITTNKEEGLAIARAIAQELGDTVCYDLQLVPYVPSQIVRDLLSNSNTLCLEDLETANYDVVTKTFTGVTTNTTFVLYVSSCKGTFDIPVTLNVKNFGYSDSMNSKLSNETEMCRLVSPNFNSMFEFSIAKNKGVTKINVDYTYKPYQPYIHMNPDFKGLYGQDWDDSRGLILGGDFSLAFLNSAWTTYQNNNKNYQAIFNRQIENMDVNNQLAIEKANFQGITGILTGSLGAGMGGALAGAKAGPYGAMAGAIGGTAMGTALSEIGYIKDMEWLNRAQTENKDYAIDMYGYQLGNIKAMPYSLARSESLTNNHKIFPIIEIYECTEQEAINLFNKIRYNGMTIMAIGKLFDYSVSEDIDKVYVKGQLIRLEDLNDDFHVVDVIYQEVYKGFFIPQGD